MGIGINFIGRKISETLGKFVELVFEARKDDNRASLLYNSAGEDSVPLNDERLAIIKVDGTGKYIIIGTLTLSQKANPGEKIFFARENKKLKEAKIVAKIKMLNNGNVIIDSNTETTGDAIGDYIRITKGETKITEKKNRTLVNEENVNDTTKKNHTLNVNGDLTINVGGDVAIIAAGKATYQGSTINEN